MERPDFTKRYNTKLSPAEEKEFLGWAKSNGRMRDLEDYDLRGFWKSGMGFAANGHGSDRFKKPNHPTFSDQSIYNGVDGFVGGRWSGDHKSGYSFEASDTNKNFYGEDGLNDYFKRNEQGVSLKFKPQAEMKERDVGFRGQAREGVASAMKALGYSNYRANEIAQNILGKLSDETSTQRATGPGTVRDIVTSTGVADVVSAPLSAALTAVDIVDAVKQGRMRDASVITGLAAAPFVLPKVAKAAAPVKKYFTGQVADSFAESGGSNAARLGPVVKYEAISRDEAPNVYSASQRELASFMKPGKKYNPDDVLKRLQGKVSKQELQENGIEDYLKSLSAQKQMLTTDELKEATDAALAMSPHQVWGTDTGIVYGVGPQFPSERHNMKVMKGDDPYGSNVGSVYHVGDSENANIMKVLDTRIDGSTRLGMGNKHNGLSGDNAIMWVRTADIPTEGGGVAKVLNEVQSDVHQAGMHRGYQDDKVRKVIADGGDMDTVERAIDDNYPSSGIGGTFFRGTNRYGALGGQIALQDAMRSGSGTLLIPGKETWNARGVPEGLAETLYGDKGVVTSEVRKHIKAVGGTESSVELAAKTVQDKFPPSRLDQIKSAIDIVKGHVAPQYYSSRAMQANDFDSPLSVASRRARQLSGTESNTLGVRLGEAVGQIRDAAESFSFMRKMNSGVQGLPDAIENFQLKYSNGGIDRQLHPYLDDYARKNNMRFDYFDDTAFEYKKMPDGSLAGLSNAERADKWEERLKSITGVNQHDDYDRAIIEDHIRNLRNGQDYGGAANQLQISYVNGQRFMPDKGPMLGTASKHIADNLNYENGTRMTASQMVRKNIEVGTDKFRRFDFDPQALRDHLNKGGGWRLPAAAGMSAEGYGNMNLRYETEEDK